MPGSCYHYYMFCLGFVTEKIKGKGAGEHCTASSHFLTLQSYSAESDKSISIKHMQHTGFYLQKMTCMIFYKKTTTFTSYWSLPEWDPDFPPTVVPVQNRGPTCLPSQWESCISWEHHSFSRVDSFSVLPAVRVANSDILLWLGFQSMTREPIPHSFNALSNFYYYPKDKIQ